MIISEQKAKEIVAAGTPAGLYASRRVLVPTPDGTRTCPLPLMVRMLAELNRGAGEAARFHGGPGGPSHHDG